MSARQLRLVKAAALVVVALTGGIFGHSLGQLEQKPQLPISRQSEDQAKEVNRAFDKVWEELTLYDKKLPYLLTTAISPPTVDIFSLGGKNSSNLSREPPCNNSQMCFYISILTRGNENSESKKIIEYYSSNYETAFPENFLRKLNQQIADTHISKVNMLGILPEELLVGFTARVLALPANLTIAPPICEWLTHGKDTRPQRVLRHILQSRELTKAFRRRLELQPDYPGKILLYADASIPPTTVSVDDIANILESWAKHAPASADIYQDFERKMALLPSSTEALGSLKMFLQLKGEPGAMALSFWGARMAKADPELGATLLQNAGSAEEMLSGWYSLVRETISGDPWTASKLLVQFPRGILKDTLIDAMLQEAQLKGEERDAWVNEISDPKTRATIKANSQ